MSVAKLDDLQPWRTITIERTVEAGKPPVTERYVLWYTTNAVFKLERAMGVGFEDLLQQLFGKESGYALLHGLLYAGLEGARMKMFPRATEWSLESVGDFIDECGGTRTFWEKNPGLARMLGEAIRASLPTPRATPDPPPVSEGQESAPEGGATTAADPSTPATTAASTGEASSTGRKTAGSAKKTSGT